MTLDEFAAVAATRIPTPAEFVAFVRGQGWRITTLDDGRASLWASPVNELARRTARMLSREPWRTGVLDLIRREQAEAAKSYTPQVEPVALPYTAPAEKPTSCQACGVNWWIPTADITETVNRGPHYCGTHRCPFRT